MIAKLGAPCAACGKPIRTAPRPGARHRIYCGRVLCLRARAAARCRTYRAAHLDLARARSRAWAAANPDKVRRWAREHPEANRRSVRLAGIKHRALHRDVLLARRRAAYAANPAPERARSLAYYHAHTGT